MISYEVGKTFPQANPSPGIETCRSQIIGSSFDVLYYINGATAKEKKTFKDSLLRFHVYVEKHIPFMAISYLGSNWTYDFTLSVAGREQGVVEAFLQDGNAVNLFLIDAKTNTLLAARLIGLYPEAELQIKMACREQLKVYQTAREVDVVISDVYRRMHTDDIIRASSTFEFKKTY